MYLLFTCVFADILGFILLPTIDVSPTNNFTTRSIICLVILILNVIYLTLKFKNKPVIIGPFAAIIAMITRLFIYYCMSQQLLLKNDVPLSNPFFGGILTTLSEMAILILIDILLVASAILTIAIKK